MNVRKKKIMVEMISNEIYYLPRQSYQSHNPTYYLTMRGRLIRAIKFNLCRASIQLLPELFKITFASMRQCKTITARHNVYRFVQKVINYQSFFENDWFINLSRCR